MTSQRLALSRVVVLALGLMLASCGGRSLTAPSTDGGAGTGDTAGTRGAAGTTGAAGKGTGAGGATAGAGGQAGGSGGAGGQGGACGPCPSAVCKAGYMSVVVPTVSCCPVCRPIDCTTVDCAMPSCGTDSHTEIPDGQCCPVCVPGPSAACNTERADYDDEKKSLLEKYNEPHCNSDADCTLVPEDNNCATTCGNVVASSLATQLMSNLSQRPCNSCPPLPTPPCAPLVALCSNGQCVAGGAPR